jgi:TatD DNase family protein
MTDSVALFDTHCHLDLPQFDGDRDAVIERASRNGVDDIVVIGFAPERWKTASALARHGTGIWMSVGLHPTEACRFDDEMERAIRDAADSERVVAIGETGLDNYWDSSSPAQQRVAFEAQIALAKELGIPFIVHQRDAERETIDVLSACNPPHHGIMHCFTGDRDYAASVLSLGLHIGLGGALTFKSRHALRDAAALVPDDRLVLETDSPYMTPEPHRGRRNEPAHVRLVAERLAELRGVSLEQVANVTIENARRVFQIDHPPVGSLEDGACR